jgi:hypothetical protein
MRTSLHVIRELLKKLDFKSNYNKLEKVREYPNELYFQVDAYQPEHGINISLADSIDGFGPSVEKREIAVYKLVEMLEIEYPAVVKKIEKKGK